MRLLSNIPHAVADDSQFRQLQVEPRLQPTIEGASVHKIQSGPSPWMHRCSINDRPLSVTRKLAPALGIGPKLVPLFHRKNQHIRTCEVLSFFDYIHFAHLLKLFQVTVPSHRATTGDDAWQPPRTQGLLWLSDISADSSPTPRRPCAKNATTKTKTRIDVQRSSSRPSPSFPPGRAPLAVVYGGL